MLHLVVHQEGEVENTMRVTIVALASLGVNFVGMVLLQGGSHTALLGPASDDVPADVIYILVQVTGTRTVSAVLMRPAAITKT